MTREALIEKMTAAYVEDSDYWAEDMTDVRADMARVFAAIADSIVLRSELEAVKCLRCSGHGDYIGSTGLFDLGKSIYTTTLPHVVMCEVCGGSGTVYRIRGGN